MARVLSSLLLTVNMNQIDIHSGVTEGVTSGCCWTNRLIFADDVVVLASSEQGLQHARGSFIAACDQVEINICTTKADILCLSRSLCQCMLHVSGYTLQQIEKIEYLRWHSRVTEGWTGRLTGWWSKRSSTWALSLCGQTTRAFKHPRAVNFWMSLSRTPSYESWVMTERILNEVQMAEMEFLRSVHVVKSLKPCFFVPLQLRI